MFHTHTFENKIVINRKPIIYITPEAMADMAIIISEVSTEVGWLGLVEKISPLEFLVKSVHLVKQDAHATTCELTQEGIAEWIMNEINETQDITIIDKVRFWGHSHVDMGIMPSGQDDNQMAEFCKACDDFFIRCIGNKRGDMKCDLYLVDAGYIISDIEWKIFTPPNEERVELIKKQITALVNEKKWNGYNGGIWYNGQYHQPVHVGAGPYNHHSIKNRTRSIYNHTTGRMETVEVEPGELQGVQGEY